jgi:hypothetical protein
MYMTGDLFFTSMMLAALLVAAWLYLHRRSPRDSLGKDGSSPCANAWIELQQRCMRLVEQDERGGADQEELHRVAAVYRAVIGEASGIRGSEFAVGEYETRSDAVLRY